MGKRRGLIADHLFPTSAAALPLLERLRAAAPPPPPPRLRIDDGPLRHRPMKIGLKLAETGYRFGTEERARIYLTNALEPPVTQPRCYRLRRPRPRSRRR